MRPLAFLAIGEEKLTLVHRSLYLLGLMTLACGLAWSNALMSIGQFILAGNWLLEGRFLEKWKTFKEDKLYQLLLSFLPFLLLGFLWTVNFDYALKDARIKLPLFLLPLVIGSTPKLNKREWQIVLGVYLLTLFLLFLASLGKYFGWIGNRDVTDKRELSIFISHIRYGLNLLFGGLLALYFCNLYGKSLRYPLLLLALALFSALLILELYTALGIGLLILGLFTLKKLLRIRKTTLKISGIASTILIVVLGVYFVYAIYQDYHQMPELSYDQKVLLQTSEKGNPYWHHLEDQRKENGVFLMRYVQEDEMRKSWNQRSQIDLDSTGKKGNAIYQTLVRFLSSKGLPKDASGVNALQENEIKAIEEGVPNRYYLDHFALQNRIYTTIYELDNYNKFGFAEGFSLGMRLEYWKTAWRIIQKYPYLGTGTGDVQMAFDLQYEIDDSSLSQKNRRRAHNQLLTIWLSLGVCGLIYFLIYLFYPLKINSSGLYPFFFGIIFLSFLTEDTLETQAGVSFFAFFNSLLLLGLGQFKTSK